MQPITTIAELESLYDTVVPASVAKVMPRLTPRYREWIDASRFVILSTVGPAGTDASPRGDAGPVVRIADDRTILMPDWRGNNRLDSLRNIVDDGRTSLMFLVPGSTNVVRCNGTALVTADETLTRSFEHDGKTPRTVIVFTLREVYFQCAKALMRSALWTTAEPPKVPTAGQFIKEVQAAFDAQAYDEGYPAYARDRMW